MWKAVAPEESPGWATSLNTVWQHKTGFWLTGKTNNHSTLWELRDPTGKVVSNQMDLPFKGGLEGIPASWANYELKHRKVI